MLSSIPTELQTQVLSYLPREDLAAVARLSQHLHAVAIKILYLKVELRSWDHVESFFLPGSLIPSGSISATEHAEARRKHWEMIKELTIRINYNHNYNYNYFDEADERSTFLIPRSLRGRNVERLQIQRLRLMGNGDFEKLIPLFNCFNPNTLVVSRSAGNVFSSFTKLVGWTRLTHVNFGFESGPLPSNIDYEKLKASRLFRKVRSGTIAVSFPIRGYKEGRNAIRAAHLLLPFLLHLRVVVARQDQRILGWLVRDGFRRKKPEVYTVVVRDGSKIEMLGHGGGRSVVSSLSIF